MMRIARIHPHLNAIILLGKSFADNIGSKKRKHNRSRDSCAPSKRSRIVDISNDDDQGAASEFSVKETIPLELEVLES